MHGSSIAMGAGNPLSDSNAVDLLDDILFTIGTDSDSVILNRSNTNLANTAITGVLEGTPVTPALAANTLIIANITNDGDILIAASDGGTSKACFFFDASAPDLILYQVGGTWTAGATTWTIPAVTLGGAVAGGDQAFTNVGDMTFAAGSILASGAVNGNTLLIRANDTTFITLTTGATDVCELAGVTLSGTTLVADGTIFSVAANWFDIRTPTANRGIALTNTANAAAGVQFITGHNRGGAGAVAGVADDVICRYSHNAFNATPTEVTYASTLITIVDATAGLEDAKFDWQTMLNGTPTTGLTLQGLTVTLGSAGILAGAGTGANGIKLKNLKNAAASALSGTQLDVEIDIGGTPYYFTCYPTKA